MVVVGGGGDGGGVVGVGVGDVGVDVGGIRAGGVCSAGYGVGDGAGVGGGGGRTATSVEGASSRLPSSIAAAETKANAEDEEKEQDKRQQEEAKVEADTESENDASNNGNNNGDDGESLLGASAALLRELDRDLDAARVLLPECHRFRKVVGCVAEAIVPGMRVHPRQVRVGEEGGCTHVMHCRSRITIDRRIPKMPGRSTLDFHGPGRRCTSEAP